MENKDVKVCWGTPDTVYYIDENDKKHEIDMSPYGYTFGIWNGVCITSSDNDDTAGLCHDDLIVYYIWNHGWPALDILSPQEAYGNDVDWNEWYELKVRYEGENEDERSVQCVEYQYDEDNDEYNIKVKWEDGEEESFNNQDESDIRYYLGFGEDVADDIIYKSGENLGNGWMKLSYQLRERPTYGDFMYGLNGPRLRGRILMDFNVDAFNPPAFIAFWNENDVTPENIKELEYAWGSDIYDYIVVTETNASEANKYGIFNMPTLRQWMNGDVSYYGSRNSEEKNRLYNIHLGNQEEKEKYFDNFRELKNKKILDKLGSMPLAKYNSMMYAEGRDKVLNKIITEEIDNFLINETAGVNNNTLEDAKEITNRLINDYIFNIYNEYKSQEIEWEENKSEEEDDDSWGYYSMDDDNPWDDLDIEEEIETSNGSYPIEIEYNEGDINGYNKGESDGDGITINFYPIKRIIDNFYEKGNIEDYEYLIKSKIYDYLSPIVLHELTHGLNTEGPTIGDTWLRTEPHRCIPREDITDTLYLFSESEMNARIGSVGIIMEDLLRELVDFGDDSNKGLKELLYSGKNFKEFIDENIINDNEIGNNELKIERMALCLSEIAGYDEQSMNTKKNAYYSDYLSQSHNKPYNFAYYLFKNDSRLRNNRRIKYLFETNFNYGIRAVYNFYKKIYDNYINRIYKACYGVLDYYVDKKILGKTV